MFEKIKSKTILILLIVFLLVISGVVLDKVAFLSPIKDGIIKITSPLQLAFSSAGKSTANFFHLLGSVGSLSQENQELKNANAKLTSANIELTEVKKENFLLRQQLGFKKRTNFRLLEAEVINRNPASSLQFLTLNKGKKDGIKEGLAVTLNGALVGKVSNTNHYTSKVLLITDQTSIVNAFIQESRASGVVKGQLGYGLKMELIPQNKVVKEGDIIITSGLGGILPKGLTIGSVDKVEKAENEIFQTAIIKPTINFKDIEMVFVVLGN